MCRFFKRLGITLFIFIFVFAATSASLVAVTLFGTTQLVNNMWAHIDQWVNLIASF